MRNLILVLGVIATPARADIDRELLALGDVLYAGEVAQIVDRMADPFDARGLFFTDAACTTFNAPQKVKGAERNKLVECLVKAGKIMLTPERGNGTIWVDQPDASKKVYTLFELEWKGGKLRSIQSAASTAAERPLRTIKRFTKVPFTVSKATQAAAEKLPERVVGNLREPDKIVENWHKVCFDVTGKLTSRRLLVKSDLAAFNAESIAALAALSSVPPLVIDGKPQPACEIVHLSNYE